MTSSEDPITAEMIHRAAAGDPTATQSLLALHRGRLRQLVAVRVDARLARRVDPSDVVQEVLVEVLQKLPDYLRASPLPFYPWLRRIALARLAHLREQHLDAEKRSVKHEVEPEALLSDESIARLAERVADSESTPSRLLSRKEMRQRVRRALEQLEESDREVLILRFLENLSVKEIAAVLEIGENAAKMRQVRALERFGRRLRAQGDELP